MSGAGSTTRVLEVGDPRWDDVVDRTDLYGQRSYLQALATGTGVRPVLIEATCSKWRGVYSLILRESGVGRWLARTPDYGGPRVDSSSVPPLQAAYAFRRVVDDVLRDLGTISEVAVIAPWLDHRVAIRQAWAARPDKTICVASLEDLEQRWRDLSKGRRADVSAAERDLTLSWEPLNLDRARAFGRRYAEAMERAEADPHWRLDSAYFDALARHGNGAIWIGTAETGTGGSSALFLVGPQWASYLFAVRWGEGRGAAAVLWRAQRALATRGVAVLLLGGGVTGAPHDPLLFFKRSLGDREEPVWLAARVFDQGNHDRAVRDGRARPLPAGAVQV